MTQYTSSNVFRRLASSRDVRLLAAIVWLEVFVVALYFQVTASNPTSVRYVVYPLLWINVGVWAVLRTRPADATRRFRVLAAAVAAGYFVLLAGIAGVIGIAPGSETYPVQGVRVAMASPGWGPMVSYATETFHVAFVPYLVVGYLALSYLVYATVIDATKSAVSGVLGIVSCVGCSFPILASLVAGVAGGSAGITATVYTYSIDISTAVFLLAVALLYWRPGFGWRPRFDRLFGR